MGARAAASSAGSCGIAGPQLQPGDSRPERGGRKTGLGKAEPRTETAPPDGDAHAPGVWAQRGKEGTPRLDLGEAHGATKPPRGPWAHVGPRLPKCASCKRGCAWQVCAQDTSVHSWHPGPRPERVDRGPPKSFVRWEHWKKAKGWSSFCAWCARVLVAFSKST